MQKMTLFIVLALFAFAAAPAALAVASPQIANTAFKAAVQPTSTPQIGIKIPWQGASVIFDPSLINVTDTSPSMPTPQPLDIPNPDMFNNLEPLLIPPLQFPDAKFEAPVITDVQLSSDGKILKATWKTDFEATTKIEYGPTNDYGSTLEDKTLIAEHAVAIPVKPGALHVRLSSTNVKKLVTQTPNIALAIPEVRQTAAAAPTTTVQEVAEDTTENPAETAAENKAPVEPPSGMSGGEAVIGGLVLLAVGIIAGFLISRRKPQA